MLQALLVVVLFSVVHLSTQQPPGVPQKAGHPPAGQGGHGHGHGHGKPLEFSSEVHNADHILEHLEKVVSTKPKEEMTEEELEFHYFKLHDYDNNNKLDGVEIGKALTHFHDGYGNDTPKPDYTLAGTIDTMLALIDADNDENEKEENKANQKVFADEEISNIVDSVVAENDENNDGYIEYFEFKRKQEKMRQTQQDQQQQQQQQQQQHHQQRQP